MDKVWRFDEDFTRNYTTARQEVIGKFLADVKNTMHLASALDLGCGVGHFSKFLSDLGFASSPWMVGKKTQPREETLSRNQLRR